MPREKIQLRTIQNKPSLQVTFSKRRKGLFKKADELAIMCGAQVGIIVFSAANKLTHFGHPSLEEVIANWNVHPDNTDPLENPPLDLNVEEECEALEKKISDEEQIVRLMNNKQYGNLSLQELHQLEEFMRYSLKRHNTKEREHSKQLTEEVQNMLNSLKMPSQEEKDLLSHQEVGTEEQMTPIDPLCLTLGTTNWDRSHSHLQ